MLVSDSPRLDERMEVHFVERPGLSKTPYGAVMSLAKLQKGKEWGEFGY